jgi:hypothetical protein
MLLCEERRKLSLFFIFEKSLPGTKHDFLTNKAGSPLSSYSRTDPFFIILLAGRLGFTISTGRQVFFSLRFVVKNVEVVGWTEKDLAGRGCCGSVATVAFFAWSFLFVRPIVAVLGDET